jgi:hypothetical protein
MSSADTQFSKARLAMLCNGIVIGLSGRRLAARR